LFGRRDPGVPGLDSKQLFGILEHMYVRTSEYAVLKAPRPQGQQKSSIGRLGVALAVFALLAFGLARSALGGAPGSYETITVQPGDTVWSIAATRYPESDTRAKVGEIEHDNGLSGPELRPGQRLKLPIT